MADAIYGILNYPALAHMFIKNGKEEVIRLKWDNSAGMCAIFITELLKIKRTKIWVFQAKKRLLYFQVHQPFSSRDTGFLISDISLLLWWFLEWIHNEEVADKCYLPANNIILDLIQKHKGKFKVTFSSQSGNQSVPALCAWSARFFQKTCWDRNGGISCGDQFTFPCFAEKQTEFERRWQTTGNVKGILGVDATSFRNTE